MLKRAISFLLFATSSFASTPDVSILKNLAWREVGPFRGGRSSAVAGTAGQRDVYHFGSCGGGLRAGRAAGGTGRVGAGHTDRADRTTPSSGGVFC